MLQILRCEQTEHEWSIEEVLFKEDQYYGTGLMKQRHCHKCSNIEYIQFVSDKGILTDIGISYG